MPRQPEVFVHELGPEQAQRLVRIARTSKDRVRPANSARERASGRQI